MKRSLANDWFLKLSEQTTMSATSHYTFSVPITFEMQFTFPSDDVELVPFPDNGLPEYCPIDSALEALRAEMTEYLQQTYPIHNLQIPKLLIAFLGSD